MNLVEELLSRPKFVDLRKTLESDSRYRISTQEYFAMAEKHGVEKSDAENFLGHLSKATVVARFQQAPNFVFLKPELLSTGLLHLLDATAEGQRTALIFKQNQVTTLKKEIAALEIVKNALDKKAARGATLSIWALSGFMVAQLTVVARLTWWELSWDIMEPVTYLLTYSTSIAAILYFGLTRKDYTYEGFWERSKHKKALRLYERNNFDLKKYNAILSQIAEIEREISELGGPYHLPPHIIDPQLIKP